MAKLGCIVIEVLNQVIEVKIKVLSEFLLLPEDKSLVKSFHKSFLNVLVLTIFFTCSLEIEVEKLNIFYIVLKG